MTILLILLLLVIVSVLGRKIYIYLLQEQEKVIGPKDKYDQAQNEFVNDKEFGNTIRSRNIKFAIIAGILFLFAGYLGSLMVDFFAPWQKVTEAPVHIFEARDGLGYGGEENRIANPCDYSSPEFSELSIPLEDIVECVQLHHFYETWRETYIRDSRGDIWKWSSGFNRRSILILLGFTCLSLGLFFVAIIVVVKIGEWMISFMIARKRQNKK